MSAPSPPTTTPRDHRAIVVRPSLLRSGLLEYALVVLVGIACIALVVYAGGLGPLSDATDAGSSGRHDAVRLVVGGIILFPFYLYALVKGATARVTLAGDGIRARPKRFGWNLLRFGSPSLLPWPNVTAVRPHIAFVGDPPDARPALNGVRIVGATRAAYWEIDLTPEMTSWTAAMVFLLEHVDPKVVAPDVWRLLPQSVTHQLSSAVWPRPTPQSGLRGFVSRLIRYPRHATARPGVSQSGR